MEKLFLSVNEVSELTGLGRSKILELAYAGKIPSVLVGRRRLFPGEVLREWARDLVARQVVQQAENGCR